MSWEGNTRKWKYSQKRYSEEKKQEKRIARYADPVALLCHDEGKLLGLPWNRVLRDDDGFIYDVIVGTCLVVGLTEDDLGSLPEDLVDKYAEMFQYSL